MSKIDLCLFIYFKTYFYYVFITVTWLVCVVNNKIYKNSPLVPPVYLNRNDVMLFNIHCASIVFTFIPLITQISLMEEHSSAE